MAKVIVTVVQPKTFSHKLAQAVIFHKDHAHYANEIVRGSRTDTAKKHAVKRVKVLVGECRG